MKRSNFVFPGRKNKRNPAGKGGYPIPDKAHARNALARVAQHGSPSEMAKVRAKVHAKYPDMGSMARDRMRADRAKRKMAKKAKRK